MISCEGSGAEPVGYGFDSMAAGVMSAQSLCGLSLDERRTRLHAIDAEGRIATPNNSNVNELVVEAARRSLSADGALSYIDHDDALEESRGGRRSTNKIPRSVMMGGTQSEKGQSSTDG